MKRLTIEMTDEAYQAAKESLELLNERHRKPSFAERILKAAMEKSEEGRVAQFRLAPAPSVSHLSA